MLKRVVYIVTTEHSAERSDFVYRKLIQPTCVEQSNASRSTFKITTAVVGIQ